MANDVILSERLRMPLLTATRMERLLTGDVASVEAEVGAPLAGWWTEVEWLVRYRLRQVQEHPTAEPWLLRPIVLHADAPAAIGLINFHGLPDDRGFAEVGYELHPEHRGHGYAIEAVRAMFDWAASEHGVRRFRAAIAPGNERSLNLVRKLGMAHVGAQWDTDDGLELIYTVDDWEPTA